MVLVVLVVRVVFVVPVVLVVLVVPVVLAVLVVPLSNYRLFFPKKKALPIFLPQKWTLQTIHGFQSNLGKLPQ